MAWFILARLLFFVGVTYTATALQPLPWGVPANAAFGAVLAAAAIVLEWRLPDVSVPRILGAVLGASLGLLFAGLLDRSMVWTDRPPVDVLPPRHRPVVPVHGVRDWRPPGRVAGTVAAAHPVPRHGAAAAAQDPRHQRHHRRARGGHLRDRLPRRHARRASVRAEGTAAGRRLERLDEAQSRPARPRHPPEDPEDDRCRSDGLRPGFPRGEGSRPEADRARPRAAGEDRHQRLQPEQGGAAARRRRAQHQRARERDEAGRAPRRGHEGVHPEGRQGVQPGRRLPGRRHHGGRRQRPQDDQQDDRHRGDQRAADHGRQDDLRPPHRGWWPRRPFRRADRDDARSRARPAAPPPPAQQPS